MRLKSVVFVRGMRGGKEIRANVSTSGSTLLLRNFGKRQRIPRLSPACRVTFCPAVLANMLVNQQMTKSDSTAASNPLLVQLVNTEVIRAAEKKWWDQRPYQYRVSRNHFRNRFQPVLMIIWVDPLASKRTLWMGYHRTKPASQCASMV